MSPAAELLRALRDMSVSDDELIRRKLLTEGDGGNDDKRIVSLLKTFIKWCNSSENAEESDATYQRMLAQLVQCETSVEKAVQVFDMNSKEQQHYSKLYSDIDDSIKKAQEKIAECKQDLHQAKRVRRNRQEYDAMAKSVAQFPDRLESQRQLAVLNRDLEALRQSEESIDAKLDLRRKQFHVLVCAIHEMQHLLEEEEDRDKMETDAM